MAEDSTTTPTRRAQRRAELGRRLLEATEALMGTDVAFTDLSVNALASAAGISRATFYVYFEDKSQLLQALAEEVAEGFRTVAQRWWDTTERPSHDELHGAIADTVALHRRHRAVIWAILEMSSYDAAIAAFYDDLMAGLIDGYTEAIEQAQATGAIGALAARPTATALTWMIERCCHQTARATEPDAAADAALVDALTEIVWRTLYLAPSR
ncbi:TetR/AcrR family transcriptional regulator [Nocardioides sp.]|uniref:TetR/AcrR family transcriptional regulator n=1 Tax=Nocardioides sp. TaxID=35761 RepID=UPI003511FF31